MQVGVKASGEGGGHHRWRHRRPESTPRGPQAEMQPRPGFRRWWATVPQAGAGARHWRGAWNPAPAAASGRSDPPATASPPLTMGQQQRAGCKEQKVAPHWRCRSGSARRGRSNSDESESSWRSEQCCWSAAREVSSPAWARLPSGLGDVSRPSLASWHIEIHLRGHPQFSGTSVQQAPAAGAAARPKAPINLDAYLASPGSSAVSAPQDWTSPAQRLHNATPLP